jgi:hypothetical protein
MPNAVQFCAAQRLSEFHQELLQKASAQVPPPHPHPLPPLSLHQTLALRFLSAAGKHSANSFQKKEACGLPAISGHSITQPFIFWTPQWF